MVRNPVQFWEETPSLAHSETWGAPKPAGLEGVLLATPPPPNTVTAGPKFSPLTLAVFSPRATCRPLWVWLPEKTWVFRMENGERPAKLPSQPPCPFAGSFHGARDSHSAQPVRGRRDEAPVPRCNQHMSATGVSAGGGERRREILLKFSTSGGGSAKDGGCTGVKLRVQT